MIRSLSIAVLMFLAAGNAHAGRPSLPKPRNRQVQLDPAQDSVQVDILGAPFVLTALVMPEPFTAASCGNCYDPTDQTQVADRESKNWELSKAREENTIYLRPTRLPSADHPMGSFFTTVHVTLVGGFRININLRLADVVDSEPPDAEVAFMLPEQATLAGRLSREKKKQEEEYNDRVARAAGDRLLGALLGAVECEAFDGRPWLNDKLYVRVRQTCVRRGEPPLYWVSFEVTNRSSNRIDLGRAILSDGVAGDNAEAQSRHLFQKPSLKAGEHTFGIALVELAANQSRPADWQLLVLEEGGGRREILVTGIEF